MTPAWAAAVKAEFPDAEIAGPFGRDVRFIAERPITQGQWAGHHEDFGAFYAVRIPMPDDSNWWITSRFNENEDARTVILMLLSLL